MTKPGTYLLAALFAGLSLKAGAQRVIADNDTTKGKVDVVTAVKTTPDRVIDSVMRNHTPRKAAIRSAILPGWGQAYNRKYWKMPIVYAAIGIPTYALIYNLTWYKRTRYAYSVLATHDSTRFGSVHPKLQSYIQYNALSNLQNLRNEFRRDVDYSILFIALFWGLNIIDASVDAHLKTFDISPDLSLKFRPGYSEMANTSGLSLVLTIH